MINYLVFSITPEKYLRNRKVEKMEKVDCDLFYYFGDGFVKDNNFGDYEDFDEKSDNKFCNGLAEGFNDESDGEYDEEFYNEIIYGFDEDFIDEFDDEFDEKYYNELEEILDYYLDDDLYYEAGKEYAEAEENNIYQFANIERIMKTSDLTAPPKSDISITGKVEIGVSLTAIINNSKTKLEFYVYHWYRADNALGLNLESINGAYTLSYTLTERDLGKYIIFKKTPIMIKGVRMGHEKWASTEHPVVSKARKARREK
jgi:hypothetical protein